MLDPTSNHGRDRTGAIDFPLLNAHALWHLSTAPIAKLWYGFVIEFLGHWYLACFLEEDGGRTE